MGAAEAVGQGERGQRAVEQGNEAGLCGVEGE